MVCSNAEADPANPNTMTRLAMKRRPATGSATSRLHRTRTTIIHVFPTVATINRRKNQNRRSGAATNSTAAAATVTEATKAALLTAARDGAERDQRAADANPPATSRKPGARNQNSRESRMVTSTEPPDTARISL